MIKNFIISSKKKMHLFFSNAFTFLPHFIFLLIILYIVSDVLTSNQTYHNGADRSISKVLIVTIAVACFVSSVIIYFSKKKYKQISYKTYMFFGFLLLIGLLPIMRDLLDKRLTSNAITIALYPLTFLSLSLFFCLYPIDRINKKIVRVEYYFVVFLCIFFMIFYYFKVRSTPLASLNFGKAIFAHIYLVVGLFPICIILFNRNELIFNFILIFIAIVFSDKGVPLLSFIVLLTLGVLSKIVKNGKFLFTIFFSIVILLVGVVLLDNFVLNNAILGKILDQSTIIRLDGYRVIFEDFKSFTFFQIVFGKGVSAVIEIRGLAAHNDFLEYAYDYGLLGLSLFIAFIVFLFLLLFSKTKMNKKLRLYSIILTITISPILLFSALFSNVNLFLFLSIGIILNKNRDIVFSLKETEELFHGYCEVFI